MKKFLIKIIAFALIIFICLISVNKRYLAIHPPEYDWTDKFKSIPDNIEICNFGSSHGLYGYNYVNYEDKYTCFNFSLSGQSLSYDYRLLDYYQKHLSEGCTVFITLSHFSFIGIDETEQATFESKNQRYYKILDPLHIKNYSIIDYMYRYFSPCLSVPANSLISTLFNSIDTSASNIDPWWYSQTADDIDLDTNAEATATGFLINEKLDENGNYIINQEEINSLYNILSICDKNNYKPIFITTPYLSEYSGACEKIAPDGIELFYEIVDEIVKETGISYYDYSHDERFCERHDLFYDCNHLNEAGSIAFTDVIMQEIIQ